jgi:hypothetical protein
MSGEAEVQAPPWAGLTYEDYRAEVLRLSAYPDWSIGLCAEAGVIAEIGEVLGLFDVRRALKKGPPAREAVRAELGDVLWYAVLGDVEGRMRWYWRGSWHEACTYPTDTSGIVHGIMREVRALCGDERHGCAPIARLAGALGFGLQEVAFYNLEKLRARQSAGTLHDREARVGASGGV